MISRTIQDTIVVNLSDMHSGGTTALFLPRFWEGMHGNHTPTKDQKQMWRHFDKCAKIIREKREGKRLIVVHDGDAIDGVHHDSPQIITRNKNEQIEIHTEIMDHFLQVSGWDRDSGDKLYYVTGTEIHVNDSENIIGEDLGAEMDGEKYAFDFLPLSVNNKILWFAHHGGRAGKGANKGNALRNNLKHVYFDCLNEKQMPPDMLITGHSHDPFYETYNQWLGDDIHVLHGIILPSWQKKTRFAYRVAPVQVNKIGMAYFEITAEGEIHKPRFELLKDKNKPVVV
jgi:hypothetical protein